MLVRRYFVNIYVMYILYVTYCLQVSNFKYGDYPKLGVMSDKSSSCVVSRMTLKNINCIANQYEVLTLNLFSGVDPFFRR